MISTIRWQVVLGAYPKMRYPAVICKYRFLSCCFMGFFIFTMLFLFVVSSSRSFKILLFPMAAVYIVSYFRDRLVRKPLFALLVIGAPGFFHMILFILKKCPKLMPSAWGNCGFSPAVEKYSTC
jgi:hypothetical protein